MRKAADSPFLLFNKLRFLFIVDVRRSFQNEHFVMSKKGRGPV
jgi:hypothetical protein